MFGRGAEKASKSVPGLAARFSRGLEVPWAAGFRFLGSESTRRMAESLEGLEERVGALEAQARGERHRKLKMWRQCF